MKAISVRVEEPCYLEFKRLSSATGKSVGELLREAMRLYLEQRPVASHSILDIKPAGRGPVRPWTRAEIADEMSLGDSPIYQDAGGIR